MKSWLGWKCKVAIVCLLEQLSFKGMAVSFRLCLPLSCLSSSPSMICQLRPKKPPAKLWQSRARGAIGWRAADWTLVSANYCTQVKSGFFFFSFFFNFLQVNWWQFFNFAFLTVLHSFVETNQQKLADIVHVAQGGWQSARSGLGLADWLPILGWLAQLGQRAQIMGRVF